MNCAVTIATKTAEPVILFSYASGGHWFAVCTMPKCERRVSSALSAAGYRCFLPEMTRWVSHARIRTVARRPLFPRYLFVEVDPDLQGFGPIYLADGFDYILSCDGVPVPLPRTEVETLLRRQLEGEFDLAASHHMGKGSKVAIVEGKYDGLFAIITGVSGRRGLMVKLLNKPDHFRISPLFVRPAVTP